MGGGSADEQGGEDRLKPVDPTAGLDGLVAPDVITDSVRIEIKLLEVAVFLTRSRIIPHEFIRLMGRIEVFVDKDLAVCTVGDFPARRTERADDLGMRVEDPFVLKVRFNGNISGYRTRDEGQESHRKENQISFHSQSLLLTPSLQILRQIYEYNTVFADMPQKVYICR